jgi:hypothetical protein
MTTREATTSLHSLLCVSATDLEKVKIASTRSPFFQSLAVYELNRLGGSSITSFYKRHKNSEKIPRLLAAIDIVFCIEKDAKKYLEALRDGGFLQPS